MNWSKSGRINDVVQQNLRSFRALTWSILSKVLTLYKQNTINTRRSTAPTTQTGITQFGSFLEGAATLVSGVNSVPTCVRITEALLTKRDVTIYYLLTESEVIKGKSQTGALMYWPSDSEINTSRPRSEICNNRASVSLLKKFTHQKTYQRATNLTTRNYTCN